ncbi:MAG: PSD1 and planctomycete cytochrome C domain-containing protein [Planctomycetaceae bacterium]
MAITCVAASAADKPNPKGVAFFETKIRPVLTKYCYQCHSARSKKPKGELLLDTKAGIRKGGESGHAVVPGNLKESLLIAAIRHTGDVSEMPPKQKLPDAVIADFEKWVKMGAPDPRNGKKAIFGPRKIDFKEARKFWAFVPPKMPSPPKLKNGNWARTEIDRLLLAKMEAKGVTPVRDADKVTLIRRATFDLTGLPPTPAEVDAFLQDSTPNAFETVVDRLLKSPQFGEHWGRHWLDVVRYAESTGKERNYLYPNAWRYRNYVIDSFNADKPYDQFVREQIAGDLLPFKSSRQADEQVIATGFLAMGPKSLNERNKLKFTMDVVDDQIDVTGRAILGMTIACARCHDHKFDPIPTKDYYAIAGIFRSTQVVSGVRGRRGVRNGGGTVGIALQSGGGGKKYAVHAAKMKELQKQLRRGVTQLARAGKKGKGKKRKRLNKKQLQRLIQRMRIPAVRKTDSPQVVKVKKEMQRVVAEIKKRRKNAPPAPGLAMGVKDGPRTVDSKIFIKGDVTDQGELVPRGFLTVTRRDDDPKVTGKSGRLELAQWLTSKHNPLTARVMANRVWQHLFGVGLVKTVDNFGLNGERPQHPELLDHLAIRFAGNGWSVKSLIKEIMLTRAYQLSSDYHEKNNTIDGDNRLVWRGGRRRLNAEAIRDAILAVSGQLDRVRPKSSTLARAGQGEIGRRLNVNSLRAGGNFRSVYLPVIRQAMPEMMRVFDVADPSLVVGERDVTTVPTQALFMMNSPFVMQQSAAMAKRLFAEKGMDDAARVRFAYRLALSREPTKRESDRVLKFIAEYREMLGKNVKAGSDRELEGWTAFCQTLFASAEFRYLY